MRAKGILLGLDWRGAEGLAVRQSRRPVPLVLERVRRDLEYKAGKARWRERAASAAAVDALATQPAIVAPATEVVDRWCKRCKEARIDNPCEECGCCTVVVP